jgi:hypothetical protein
LAGKSLPCLRRNRPAPSPTAESDLERHGKLVYGAPVVAATNTFHHSEPAHRHLVCFVTFAVLLLTALPVDAQPAQVILLRHAEKPADEADVHLTARGQERAQALVTLLGRGSALTSNAPVAALYATRVTRKSRGQRTGETLAPLSQDLHLPVNTAFHSDDYAALARSVVHNSAYDGKTVIICWTHTEMAQLATALGVKPKPPAWKDKVFDRLWIITPASSSATLREVPQRLLPGDSTR